jgi:hypothetical protein
MRWARVSGDLSAAGVLTQSRARIVTAQRTEASLRSASVTTSTVSTLEAFSSSVLYDRYW